MQETTLAGTLQQQVLSLLIFSQEYGQLVHTSIPLNFWSGDAAFLQLVASIYDYIDNYKTVPGEHIVNLIDELTITSEQRELLAVVLNSCSKDFTNINAEYVLNSLQKIYFTASGQKVLMKGLDLFSKGKPEEAIDYVKGNIAEPFKLFDPGDTLLDYVTLLSNDPEDDDKNGINIGIPELDIYGIHPKPKTAFLVLGTPNVGKSSLLIHIGKEAVLQQKKVLHISLEMPKDEVLNRYLRSLFGYYQRLPNSDSYYVIKNQTFDRILTESNIKCLHDPNTIADAIDRLAESPYLVQNLVIKEFPMRSLTVAGLRSYLSGLEINAKFVPDLLIIDYADLMKRGQKQTYEESADNFEQLRGLAQEKYFSLVTASQINREGARLMKESNHPTELEDYMISEAFMKIAACDNALTINQTKLESIHQLARLHVIKARNAPKNDVLVSQCFDRAQFVTGSVELTKNFKDTVYKGLYRSWQTEQVMGND